MKNSLYFRSIKFGILIFIVGLTACKPAKTPATRELMETDTLILGAYTVPKEVYQKRIIPEFQKYWQSQTGREIKVEQSYVGSGSQARAIIGGFEADVAALSLEGDIDQIAGAGLITHNWKKRKWNGIITQSVVVIGFRAGNPMNIKGWKDLAQPGLELLCANPKTSGGAQWCVNAIIGAALKQAGHESGSVDYEISHEFLSRILKNVKVMDKSARGSMSTYERGIGDAILTYENEALLRAKQGVEFPFVIPEATILIENPVAVVDTYADKHGTRASAEAFVEFLHTDTAQRAFAEYGFRSPSETVSQEFRDTYPEPAMLFDIMILGGWDVVGRDIFGPDGLWGRVYREMHETR